MKSVLFTIICCLCVSVPSAAEVLRPADVVERTLSDNLNIHMGKTDVLGAAGDLQAYTGAFDLQLTAGVDHRIDKSSRTSPTIFGTRTDTTRFSLGGTKRWLTGTDTSVTYLNQKDATTGSAFFSPLLYNSQVSLNLSQPLLKNSLGYNDRQGLRAQRTLTNSVSHSQKRTVQRTVTQSLQSYWQWIVAKRRVSAVRSALRTAQHFLQIVEERHTLGTALASDLYSAQANVQQRRANLLQAQSDAAGIEMRLRTAIRMAPGTPLKAGRVPLQPTLHIGKTSTKTAHALRNRPDYLAAKGAATAQRLHLKMARNSMWPSLDLTGSLALNNISTSSANTALSGMDNPNWLVGLQLSIPISNRGARGLSNRAAQNHAKALLGLKALEEQIVQQVHTLHQQLAMLRQERSARQQTSRLQRQRAQVEAEQYRLGRSSSEQVVRAQDDAIAAQLGLLDATQRLHYTWLDYQLATAQFYW